MSLTYAGAFAYVDDVALLAPSISALERMINIYKKRVAYFA